MRIDQHLPPGQVRATQVHDLLGAGLRPGAPPRSPSGVEGASPAGEALSVDMPWKTAADEAIAKVEAKHGEMPDELKQRVYEDFASRASGGEGNGPVNRPPWKGWVVDATPVPVDESDPSDEVTELMIGDGGGDEEIGIDDAGGEAAGGGDVSSGEMAETDYSTEYIDTGADDFALVQDEDDAEDTESLLTGGGGTDEPGGSVASVVIDAMTAGSGALDSDGDGIVDTEDVDQSVAA